MVGILLISLGTLLTEITESLGKDQVAKKKQSIYTMGFLGIFAGVVFFIALAIIRQSWIFAAASLPTFLPRVVLEILQAHLSVIAITTADRSTFGFLRTLTIPLLLGADLLLGYHISLMQFVGIGIIITTLLFLFLNHGLSKKGAWFTLFTAVNATATISLYQYNITHFNSVEAEQSLMRVALLVYFFIAAKRLAGENPFRFFRERIPRVQSIADGAASVVESFAYLFIPASIIITARRSFSVLWSIVFGQAYFKEKRPIGKYIGFSFIVLGLIFLTQ